MYYIHEQFPAQTMAPYQQELEENMLPLPFPSFLTSFSIIFSNPADVIWKKGPHLRLLLDAQLSDVVHYSF